MEILPVRIPPGSTLSGATPSALVVSTEGVTTVMPLGGGPQSTLPTLQQVIAVAPGSPSLAVGIGTDTNKLHIIGFDGISNFEPIPIVGPFVAAFAGHHLLVVDSERSHVIDVQTGARSDASLPASVPPTAKVRSAVGTIAGAVTVLWEDEAAVMLDGTPTYLLRQWSSDTNSFAELAAPAETQSGRLLLATTTTELLLLNERDVTVGAERWRETWVYRRGPGEEWLGSMVGERHHTCPVRLAATDRLTLTVICGQPYLALDGRWVDDKPPGELRGQATDGASLIGAFADGSVVRWS